jgi:hypothetical protein
MDVGLKLGKSVNVGLGVLVWVAVGFDRARKLVTLPASHANNKAGRTTRLNAKLRRCLLNGSSPQ